MTSHDRGYAGAEGGQSAVPTLYVGQYSLYSIIARFACELGRSLNPDTSPGVQYRVVDLQKDENLSEEYLTLSPKGQVPILKLPAGPDSSKILEESRDILDWLCAAQTELVPDAYREDIESHLAAFYSFHAKPLNITPKERVGGMVNKAAAMLERADISESHRRCLEVKSVHHDTIHAKSVDPDRIKQVESLTRQLINSLSDLIRRKETDEAARGGIYILGNTPTVLDAVATTVGARLMDLKRDDLLVDPTIKDYASRVMDTDEWRRTTEGRKTIYVAPTKQAA